MEFRSVRLSSVRIQVAICTISEVLLINGSCHVAALSNVTVTDDLVMAVTVLLYTRELHEISFLFAIILNNVVLPYLMFNELDYIS